MIDISKTIEITEIKINSSLMYIYANKTFGVFFWLENSNKHLPDIFNFAFLESEHCFMISTPHLIKTLHSGQELKLSVSSAHERLNYQLKCKIYEINKNSSIKFSMDETGSLLLRTEGKNNRNLLTQTSYKTNDSFFYYYNNPFFIPKCSKVKTPLNILVIGTCFSRSVFKSDNYFNSDYKMYFCVSHTLFHNSLISLMSEKIEDVDFTRIRDLNTDKVKQFIEVEFKKNLFEIIDNHKIDYIFMDNYIDAVRPLIKWSENQYITYNKYFSESIFKRTFGKCHIVYPVSDEYKNLFNISLEHFSNELIKRNLQNRLILLGGRLSEYKINTNTNQKFRWHNSNWIKSCNKNWDTIDELFLKKLPNTYYLNMRKTKWVSDIDSPLIGGASPSHYQQEYYKEIYNKLKMITIQGN